MKKTILFLTVFPVMVFSQMTQQNEPSIGESITLYLCDSNATQYENVVGSNVTWDYSFIAGVSDPNNPGNVRTKDVVVTAPDPLTLDSLFTGSTKKYSIGSSINTYYSSTAEQRISQGYIFNELGLGNVIVDLTRGTNPNPEIMNDYPFTYSGINSDIFSGNITSSLTGTLSTSGTSKAKIDGFGTLKLPGNNSYSNVLRYHLKDSATAVVFGQNVSVVRNWYEYYDYSISSLPIFISINVKFNSLLINNSSTIVLSKNKPSSFVGINDRELSTIKIYPNPTTDFIFVNTENDFDFEIFTVNGIQISKGKNSKIDLSLIPSGFYLININSDSSSQSFKVFKQ